MIVVVVVEGIVFFEGRGFVRGRSEDELLVLVIVVVVIKGIMFAVFSSGNMRDLIVSVTVNLTSSIISLFMAFGKYES
jgi:hypothetical protein